MNNIKSSLQKAEFNNLKDHNRIVLRWATGCGKSKMAIDLINNVVNDYHNNVKPSVLFVVAERAHIGNWKEEFKKWSLREDKVNITMICYASLHKIQNEYFDVVVFDEAHHCFSEKRLAILETLKASYIYLLSATLSYTKISIIEDIFGEFKVSTVSLKEAINKDILPDPKVYIVELTLDNTVANQEIVIGKGDNLPVVRWEDRARYIYKKKPCRIKCTAFQKYVEMSNDMEYWKERYERSHDEVFRIKWVNIGSRRKAFLGSLKTEPVRKLINSLNNKKRYVCFCSSVAQSEELNSKHTISSRRTTKKNQEIIDAFNNKDINQIFAVGMITEGMNLTDIQVGIIAQLDGQERLFVQKFGRAMRAEGPITYIFYFKDTQDEVYLKNALENIDSKFIKHIKI